jgi:protoheme ferro-lyase
VKPTFKMRAGFWFFGVGSVSKAIKSNPEQRNEVGKPEVKKRMLSLWQWKVIRWVLQVIWAFFTGWFLVRYLTVHPLHMSLMLFLTTLFGAGTLLLFFVRFRVKYLLAAIPIVVITFMGGYCVQNENFLNTPDRRVIPELTRQKGDPGDGHTAIIYLTHGEPETYDPIGWINQFREFDEQKIAFVPWLVRPLFAFQLRNGYLEIGRSNHVFMHSQMLKSLERLYRREGDSTTRFYLSFLDASPTPHAAAIQSLNEGASRIVVSEVFLTVSNHTTEGENQIKELEIEKNFNVPVQFTTPLYNSETLKRMFLERADANTTDIDKSKVAVLLVGHGQPDEWDKEWPTETAHELDFRNGVLDLLANNGYQRNNLSLAWMEFKEPHPAPKIEQLVESGVERVLYFSAAISADAMHSQYDVPELVNEAKVPVNVELRNLGAWNDDPLVIQAIKEKIDAVIKAAAK